MSEISNVERKARPAKGQSRAEPNPRHYGPIGDFRGILTVNGKDGEWMYRWFSEKSANGQRILNAQMSGWDLVDITKEESLKVGEEYVEATKTFGSVIRKPADKEGNWLYLMRMPLWAYEEVQAKKQVVVDNIEANLFREHDPDTDDGLYGKNRIKHGLRRKSTVDPDFIED